MLIGGGMGALQGRVLLGMAVLGIATAFVGAFIAAIVALVYGLNNKMEVVVDHFEDRLIVNGVPVAPLEDVTASIDGERLKLTLPGLRYLLRASPATREWILEHLHAPKLDVDAFDALRDAECPEGITPAHHGWTTEIEVRHWGEDAYSTRAVTADLAQGDIEIGGRQHQLEELTFRLRGMRSVEVISGDTQLSVLKASHHGAAAWIAQNARRLDADPSRVPAELERLRAHKASQTDC